MNTLLLRPLPVRDPGNVYLLTVVHQDNEQPHNVSWAGYQDYRLRSGIYGVVSYSASQRTQEIGVRMALGAQRRDILRLVVGPGLLLVGAGIVMVSQLPRASRLLAGLLFGISPTDPTTFVSVPLILGTTALVASYVPAFRAARIDPMRALRQD